MRCADRVRGGREGLLGLKHVIESGRPAIFTADGPRGPIYQTKMGPIKLAQMTGAPIGAFHLAAEARVGDAFVGPFLVPKPFTRIVVSWAQWTRVPDELCQRRIRVEARRVECGALNAHGCGR